MNRCLTVFIVTIVLVAPTLAFAQQAQRADFSSLLRRHLEGAESNFDRALSAMESLPDDADFASRKVAVERYLHAANYLVYSAKANANYKLDGDSVSTNSDLKSLVSLGYLKEWPKNPLNGMEDMRVLSDSDPFSAGDLVFILAPSNESISTTAGPAPLSFKLFVYGFSETQGSFGKHVLTDKNTSWGSIPRGALYGRDYWVQSDSDSAESRKRFEEWKEQHPEDWERIQREQGVTPVEE